MEALCQGFDEVREAFRAVQAFSPTAEAPSEVEQIGANQFVVKTRIRYKVPGWGGKGFVVPSEVIVTTVSEEDAAAAAAAAAGTGATGAEDFGGYRKDAGSEGEQGNGGGDEANAAARAAARRRMQAVAATTSNKGKIERIEERWNSARLLEGFPFDAMRRLVGMASFAATPIFISSSSSSRD